MKRRPKPEGGDAGAELPVGGVVRTDRVGPQAKPVFAAPPIAAPPASTSSPWDARYPEWDAARGTYRANWCHVREYDPGLLQKPGLHPKTDRPLRKALARLGLTYERHNRQDDGDCLDLTALVDFVVAREMGEPGDERVYRARLRTAHDMSVVILLDASGSTAELKSSGTPVFDEQRALVASLAATLEHVGDRVALFGFNSRGRHQVRFLRIKDFDDRFNERALGRLSSLDPGGFTRLGAAIRHATMTLIKRGGTANKLMVVVSDGFPYDDEYEGTYAERDTRRALTEAIAQGVGCVCLSVGSSVDDAGLARLWGSASHLRLSSADELGKRISPLLISSLRAAARATRPTTRNPSGFQSIR